MNSFYYLLVEFVIVYLIKQPVNILYYILEVHDYARKQITFSFTGYPYLSPIIASCLPQGITSSITCSSSSLYNGGKVVYLKHQLVLIVLSVHEVVNRQTNP